MRRIGIAVAAVACVLSSSLPSRGAAGPSDETRRLVEVCKLWGQVKFLHPYVWTHDVDWDAALVAALPKIRAAASEDEYAAAVDGMLKVLADPATHVVPAVPPAAPHAEKTTPIVEWPAPGVLLVRLTGRLVPAAFAELKTALGKAKSVVFDLRAADPETSWANDRYAKGLYPLLAYRELRVPPVRYVVHNGYHPQSSSTSGGYYSAFEERAVEVLPRTPDATRKRVAFLVNVNSGVPDEALALQATGDAVILAQGASFDELTVASPLPLGEKHRALVRAYELEPIGVVAPHADAVVPADAGDDAILKLALAKLKAPVPKGKPLPPLPPLTWRPDEKYPTMKAPDVEHRLLALFRLWNVIDRFYPYKALLDEKWDTVLPAFLPRVIAADGAKAYAEVMAELSTHIEDSHVHLGGAEAELGIGWAKPPLQAQMIERQPTVVAVAKEGAALGIHVGDVITAVDGEPIGARMTRLRRFVAGSNEPVRELFTLFAALGGAPASTVKITVRDAKGATREVTATRAFATDRGWRSGDVVKILDGNVGYVDLDRLQQQEVDAMFDKLAKTRAIIFDMRGYPNGTAWPIAPRLNVRAAEFGASFERPFVSGDPGEGPSRWGFRQRMPENAGKKPLYRGKTFMLVDERTISQAEHTGLFFEAAAGTKFIGSTSAGANGDVTNLTLPGGLGMSFTGHDVRHADGRQLQRVGLPVDIRVTPTLAGIRAGRDEVLERALVEARK
ncbi:MAG TPA: S41 family peptidase [Polyangia bacterium]|jgi:C-terminal processing protease CtpA/Prc